MGKVWTRQDDRTLISLIYKRTPIKEISFLLRRSIRAIEDRAWVLGYSRREICTEKSGERAKKYREHELGLL